MDYDDFDDINGEDFPDDDLEAGEELDELEEELCSEEYEETEPPEAFLPDAATGDGFSEEDAFVIGTMIGGMAYEEGLEERKRRS